MAEAQAIIETRRAQMFPPLEAAEIERVRRFGAVRTFADGEALATVGQPGHGLVIVLVGRVDIFQHDQSDRRTLIVNQPIHHLFLFIGAEPNTDWLAGSGVALDAKGFVLTGQASGDGRLLESSRRGVFAIGDVRSGSIKRVAAAVGEGAQVVAAVHGLLAGAAPPVPGATE